MKRGAYLVLLMPAGLIAGLLIHRRSRRAALGYIGSCIAITERRQAEEAWRDTKALRQSHAKHEGLAGRLIAAHEAECARIARRLHDDVSQQLAVISIAMSECQRSEMRPGGELLEALSAMQQQIIALAEDVRLLSHDVHPGALEHAELVDALRSHCGEFAHQHSLNVVFDADDDLVIPNLTISFCLYRVAQEALRNIARHADARHVQVTVRRVEEEVRLMVVDDGKGFAPVKAWEQGGGLGLRSIEERIRMVGGRLSIETAPHAGTTLTVWVRLLVPTVRELAGA
jgi:two-component system sensor histidine kinase UhpB